MPEPTTAPVVDLVPPVAPVITRDTPDDPEVRVLGRNDSVRAWVETRSPHPKEYGHLRLGDVLRALITGPRNELERRVLSEGTDSAGGFTVPDILLARWIDRLRAALVVVQAGAQTVPLTSDVTKIARLLSDPVPAWRSENAAVAESDPVFEAVTFAPKSLDVFFKTSRELVEDLINAAEIPAALVGGSLRARTAVFVDQSIGFRITLKPIDSSRRRVTMTAALMNAGSLGWSTTTGRLSYPDSFTSCLARSTSCFTIGSAPVLDA